jgi:hypothetical protein
MAIGGRSQRIENQQHVVILDQLSSLLECRWRAISVVVGDEVDCAAVDSTLVVDHPDKRGFRLADGRVGRRRSAVRHDVANLDLASFTPGPYRFWAAAAPETTGAASCKAPSARPALSRVRRWILRSRGLEDMISSRGFQSCPKIQVMRTNALLSTAGW